MKIVIDMNLSPKWVPVLENGGHDAVHWSDLGFHNAPDREIMEWARINKHIVFTNDLDFGTILASTNAVFPSVVQIRGQGISPRKMKKVLLLSLTQFEKELSDGALVTVNEKQSRVRVLPLRGRDDDGKC